MTDEKAVAPSDFLETVYDQSEWERRPTTPLTYHLVTGTISQILHAYRDIPLKALYLFSKATVRTNASLRSSSTYNPFFDGGNTLPASFDRNGRLSEVTYKGQRLSGDNLAKVLGIISSHGYAYFNGADCTLTFPIHFFRDDGNDQTWLHTHAFASKFRKSAGNSKKRYRIIKSVLAMLNLLDNKSSEAKLTAAIRCATLAIAVLEMEDARLPSAPQLNMAFHQVAVILNKEKECGIVLKDREDCEISLLNQKFLYAVEAFCIVDASFQQVTGMMRDLSDRRHIVNLFVSCGFRLPRCGESVKSLMERDNRVTLEQSIDNVPPGALIVQEQQKAGEHNVRSFLESKVYPVAVFDPNKELKQATSASANYSKKRKKTTRLHDLTRSCVKASHYQDMRHNVICDDTRVKTTNNTVTSSSSSDTFEDIEL
jgi:hypothetical protein